MYLLKYATFLKKLFDKNLFQKRGIRKLMPQNYSLY